MDISPAPVANWDWLSHWSWSIDAEWGLTRRGKHTKRIKKMWKTLENQSFPSENDVEMVDFHTYVSLQEGNQQTWRLTPKLALNHPGVGWIWDDDSKEYCFGGSNCNHKSKLNGDGSLTMEPLVGIKMINMQIAAGSFWGKHNNGSACFMNIFFEEWPVDV